MTICLVQDEFFSKKIYCFNTHHGLTPTMLRNIRQFNIFQISNKAIRLKTIGKVLNTFVSTEITKKANILPISKPSFVFSYIETLHKTKLIKKVGKLER